MGLLRMNKLKEEIYLVLDKLRDHSWHGECCRDCDDIVEDLIKLFYTKLSGLKKKIRKKMSYPHKPDFEEIKLEGKPYKITREAQKLYGIKSNLGKYTQVNDGKRNPKTILEYSIIQGGNEYTGHPTQKPIKLIRYLIKASTNENDLILDCFAGSGTTLVASKQLNRKFIGFEINPSYIKMAKKRLAQGVLI